MTLVPADLIERETYTRRVEPFIGKPVIKVFTGHRRTGKSYILYQIMARILKGDSGANIIYINKEDIAFDFIRDYSGLSDYIKGKRDKKRRNYIFLDEIQEITQFEKAVRSLLTDRKNDIYITGSNSRLLSGEFATLLGGRTVEFSVHTLAYREFLLFHKLEDNEESLEKYLLYGGLPFLFNLRLDNGTANEYLKNIYNTIVLRDVVYRHKIRNIYFLEQLVRFLADNIGSLFSAKSISDFLKSQKVMIPHNQVNTYAGYLAEAFLVHRVLRYDITGRRLFEIGEKYYFEDPGIRNVVSGFRPGDKAKMIENIIYNELLFRGYEVKTGWKGGREIDFVAEKDNETTYFQVALALDSDTTIKREFGNLLAINDNYPKIVISTDSSYKNTIQGVDHVNLRQFLMNDRITRNR